MSSLDDVKFPSRKDLHAALRKAGCEQTGRGPQWYLNGLELRTYKAGTKAYKVMVVGPEVELFWEDSAIKSTELDIADGYAITTYVQIATARCDG